MSLFILTGFVFLLGIPAHSFGQVDTLNQKDPQGRKTGFWIQYYEGTQAKQFEGRFYEGHPVGQFLRYYEDGGIKARMDYDSTGSTVVTQFYDPNQIMIAEGTYVNQKKSGNWIYYSDKKIPLFKINYVEDQLHGTAYRFDAAGNLDETTEWKHGIMDGKRITYYPNGKEQSRLIYQNGKMNGPYYFFAETGDVLIEGYHNLDLRDSTWIYRDNSGSVRFELIYDHGNLINGDALTQKEQELFLQFDQNRKLLKDPNDYIRNPEEYFRR